MLQYEKRMQEYSVKDMENVIPPELSEGEKQVALITRDEITFFCNEGKPLMGMENGKKKLLPKARGTNSFKFTSKPTSKPTCKPTSKLISNTNSTITLTPTVNKAQSGTGESVESTQNNRIRYDLFYILLPICSILSFIVLSVLIYMCKILVATVI
jgi:hypothetical protein